MIYKFSGNFIILIFIINYFEDTILNSKETPFPFKVFRNPKTQSKFSIFPLLFLYIIWNILIIWSFPITFHYCHHILSIHFNFLLWYPWNIHINNIFIIGYDICGWSKWIWSSQYQSTLIYCSLRYSQILIFRISLHLYYFFNLFYFCIN